MNEVLLGERQRVREVREVRRHEVRAGVDDQLLVGRWHALQGRDRIGVAVAELVGVVVADRDHGGAGVDGLQLLQQPGHGLRLRLALGAHARAFAADELDVDERAQVVDDDDRLARVQAGRIDGGVEDERRPIVQGLALAVDRVDECLRAALLRDLVDADPRCLHQEPDVLRSAERRWDQRCLVGRVRQARRPPRRH